MDYKRKIEHAEKVAKQLQEQITTSEIESNLKAEGLYERDINNIMISARNIIGEKYQSKIREHLIEDKRIEASEEFGNLDNELLEKLVTKESQNLSNEQKKKITKLIKEGNTAENVLAQIDTRFISADKANEQISHLLSIRNQNSGSGRLLNIFGGIGLILATGLILMTTDRLFYFLPIIGIIMIVKGLTTKKMEYNN